jgi:serine/threonine protein phosphatase 1
MITQTSCNLSLLGKLKDLLQQMQYGGWLRDRWIVFLGDIIDHHGTKQKQVIQAIIDLSKERKVTACLGNHDLWFAICCGAIESPFRNRIRRQYMQAKYSKQTFASYNIMPGNWVGLEETVPESHKKFLSMIPWVVEHPDYIFVHSGMVPDGRYGHPNLIEEEKTWHCKSIPQQLKTLRKRPQSWWRPPWLTSFNIPFRVVDYPKIVVSGHLNVPDVLRVSCANDPRKGKILVDTGAGLGGKLSVVMLPEFEILSA